MSAKDVAPSVDSMATEFLRLIDEGWQPELEEFVRRVPVEHRQECRERIQELCRLNGVDLEGEQAVAPEEVEEADDLEALAAEIQEPAELAEEEEEEPADPAQGDTRVLSSLQELQATLEERPVARGRKAARVEAPVDEDHGEEEPEAAAGQGELEAPAEVPAAQAQPLPPEAAADAHPGGDPALEEPEPERQPLAIKPPPRKEKSLEQQVMSHLREITAWRRRGIVPPADADRLSLAYRRLVEDLAADVRLLSRMNVFISFGAAMAVTGAFLIVWPAREILHPVVVWLVPALIGAGLLAAGVWARARSDAAAATSFLAAGALAVVPAVLSLLVAAGLEAGETKGVVQLLPDSPWTNKSLLVASLSAFMVSLGALGLLRRAIFAWTTALLAATTYGAFLLTQNVLAMAPHFVALRLMPLLILAIPALFFEHRGKVRWAQPFNLVALATLVGGLDMLAADVFGLIGLDGVLGYGRQPYLGFTLVGVVLMFLMVVMERLQFTSLRRGARLLEPLVVLHIMGSLYANAAHSGTWFDLLFYVGAGVILLLITPWQGRIWYLVGGLAGLALAAGLILRLELISPTVFTLGLALAGLLTAVGAYAYLARRPSGGA
ncbi:MAG: hypothetical protein ACYTEZ_12385 [Planctomycetota bacterium]|jgi:hypothetical protein